MKAMRNWSNGVVECWRNGVMGCQQTLAARSVVTFQKQKGDRARSAHDTLCGHPSLHYSITQSLHSHHA